MQITIVYANWHPHCPMDLNCRARQSGRQISLIVQNNGLPCPPPTMQITCRSGEIMIHAIKLATPMQVKSRYVN